MTLANIMVCYWAQEKQKKINLYQGLIASEFLPLI